MFRLYGNKSDLRAGISALWEFVTVGEASFSALRGERVNVYNAKRHLFLLTRVAYHHTA